MKPDKKNKPAGREELDRQYREIGISAVAAAVRYQSDAKNLAYAPADLQPREEPEDVAA